METSTRQPEQAGVEVTFLFYLILKLLTPRVPERTCLDPPRADSVGLDNEAWPTTTQDLPGGRGPRKQDQYSRDDLPGVPEDEAHVSIP